MKTSHRFFSIAAAALLMGLTACNKDVVEPNADNLPDNAVRITASIGNPFSTRSTPLVDDATTFAEGDEIYVMATGGAGPDAYEGKTTYRLSNGKWAPAEGQHYLLWKADRLTFDAFYPASVAKEALAADGNFSKFISHVPTDQNTKEKIAKADLMMTETENTYNKDEAVTLRLLHKTIKVTVRIKAFNNEYEPETKVENVRFIISSINPSITDTKEYLPYTESDGGVNSSYTILLPYVSAITLGNLKINLQPKGQSQLSADLTSLYGGWIIGKHYIVNLIVGKDKLEVGEVTVSDWSATQDLPEGHATKQGILSTGTTGITIVNLDYAKDFDEVKEVLAGYFVLTAGQPEHKFKVIGSSANLFQNGHTVFHDTEATEIDLREVTGITEIRPSQFNGGTSGDQITGLKTIVLPQTVTVIGNEAFINNVNLQTVICPNVRTIKEETFMGCTALTSMVMPLVRELKRGCFKGCAALREVELRTGITEMGANAFTEEMARNIILKVQPFQKQLEWNENKQGGTATETDIELGENKVFGFGTDATKPLIWKEVKNINMG